MAKFVDYLRKYAQASDIAREAMIGEALYYAQRLGIADYTINVLSYKQPEAIQKQARTNAGLLHSIINLYKAKEEGIENTSSIFGTTAKPKFTFSNGELKISSTGKNKVDWSDIGNAPGYDKEKYKRINQEAKDILRRAEEGDSQIANTIDFVDALHEVANEMEASLDVLMNQLIQQYRSDQEDGEIIFKHDEINRLFRNAYYKLQNALYKTDSQSKALDKLLEYYDDVELDIDSLSYFTNNEYYYFDSADSFNKFTETVESGLSKFISKIRKTAERIEKSAEYQKDQADYIAKTRKQKQNPFESKLSSIIKEMKEAGVSDSEIRYMVERMTG